MTRYLLLQNYEGGNCDVPMSEWAPADVTAHIDFQLALNAELAGLGELVGAEGLTGPEHAKIVRFEGEGAPIVTDGPYAEGKEWLAGYRMIDVASEERALEIAARSSAAPGPGGVPMGLTIEVRPLGGAPGAEQ